MSGIGGKQIERRRPQIPVSPIRRGQLRVRRPADIEHCLRQQSPAGVQFAWISLGERQSGEITAEQRQIPGLLRIDARDLRCDRGAFGQLASRCRHPLRQFRDALKSCHSQSLPTKMHRAPSAHEVTSKERMSLHAIPVTSSRVTPSRHDFA